MSRSNVAHRRVRSYHHPQFDLDRDLPNGPPIWDGMSKELIEVMHRLWLPALPAHLQLVVDGLFWGQLSLDQVSVQLRDRGHFTRLLSRSEVSRLRDQAVALLRPLVEEYAYATRNGDLMRRHHEAVRHGRWQIFNSDTPGE